MNILFIFGSVVSVDKCRPIAVGAQAVWATPSISRRLRATRYLHEYLTSFQFTLLANHERPFPGRQTASNHRPYHVAIETQSILLRAT
jgi:hypothetical protein